MCTCAVLSLSVSLAHSLRQGSHPASCKTNNNNKTNNTPTRRNKKNKFKFKCRIFILEDGNPTDGRTYGCCLTETKTIFLFSLFASDFTNGHADRQTDKQRQSSAAIISLGGERRFLCPRSLLRRSRRLCHQVLTVQLLSCPSFALLVQAIQFSCLFPLLLVQVF